MTTLIEKLREDHKAARRKVAILDVDVWVTPLTLAESTRITAKHPTDAALRQAEILVRKCEDADGKLVFTKDDKRDLASAVSGERFAAVWAAINGTSVAAQAEK